MTRDRVTIAIAVTEPSLRAAIVDRARRRGFVRFHDAAAEPLSPGPGEEVVVRRGDRLYVSDGPTEGIPVVRVHDASQLEHATSRAPDGGILAIEWPGDRVIPLENAVAARGRRFSVWVYARGPSEVPGALGALEHGADRVFVEVRSPEEVDQLETVVEGPVPARLEWTTLAITSVQPSGVGDRVLIDTTSLLRPTEGFLIGSAAAFLFHVASEAVGSDFSRPRPFRVNAGAAHSYVLMADGATRYLSELEPGEAVLAAEPAGSARAVRVGRVKIERRPLVVVTGDDGGRARTIFLQEAETVRLSTAEGRIATTQIRPGASVHGVRLPPARHLGRSVEETIEER
jgi:3-dehydroquinate synthase II